MPDRTEHGRAQRENEERAGERGRGRTARAPWRIPPKGWKDVVLRIKNQLKGDNLSIVAAGVAFYFMLSFVPALMALVTLYGLVANPDDLQRQIGGMSGFLPSGARSLIEQQLSSVVRSSSSTLGLGLVATLLGALWSASKGTQALIKGINIAYDEPERRSGLRLRALALGITAGLTIMLGVALALVAVLPALMSRIGLGEITSQLVTVGRWPLMALLAIFALAFLYRHAPCRRDARWRWLTLGSTAATVLWLGATALFAVFVANFGNYNETYGALAGVIVLLLWLMITAYSILVGAEINAEVEHQTAEDSTVGEDRPRGSRGAVKADHVGRSFGRGRARASET